MYTKRKKIMKVAIDSILDDICEEFLKVNEDACFLISNKYVEKSKTELGDEISSAKIIVSSIPIEELRVPSAFKVKSNGDITTWIDEEHVLAKVIHSNIKFTDGNINGKTIPNMYLDIEDEEKIKKLKYKV